MKRQQIFIYMILFFSLIICENVSAQTISSIVVTSEQTGHYTTATGDIETFDEVNCSYDGTNHLLILDGAVFKLEDYTSITVNGVVKSGAATIYDAIKTVLNP